MSYGAKGKLRNDELGELCGIRVDENMIPARTPEYLAGMVRELRRLPSETEWVEFKGNNENPDTIG